MASTSVAKMMVILANMLATAALSRTTLVVIHTIIYFALNGSVAFCLHVKDKVGRYACQNSEPYSNFPLYINHRVMRI